MSTQYPDPPTHAVPFIEGPNGLEFNPVWLQWFYGLTAFITASGGGGGGAADHDSLAGLQGGATGERYHTTNAQYIELVGNKAAHTVYAGPASGGATTPAFRVLTPGDIPTGAVVAFGLDGEEGEFGDRGVPGPAGPAGQSVMGPPGLDGESDSFESFGFGVTGVSVTGANGIGVSGSPITSSGTIGLSLGDITPNSVLAAPTTDRVPIIAKANASQTIANPLMQWQDSSGNEIGRLTTNAGDDYYSLYIGKLAGIAVTITGVAEEGKYNTFVGLGTGQRNTTGYRNNAFGVHALNFNTSGRRNTGFGNNALTSNTTGNDNCAVGSDALLTNSVGVENNALGTNALFACTGSYNTAVGVNTLRTLVAGIYNTAIGRAAGYAATGSSGTFIGMNAGLNVTSGAENTLIGRSAGNVLTTGGNNTLVGFSAETAANNTTNATAIGNGSVAASNQVVLGNASVTSTILRGTVGLGTTGTTIENANKLQIAGTTAATNSLGISAWSADALGSRIELGKSRGATIGTNTIVQDGDVVGSLLGYGANGTTFTNLASIGMEVDGTPGATNDMPGRIVFKTTPNGSGTLAEAMRLSQDQTALFASSVQTGTPTSGTAAAWKLGSHQSTVGLTFVTTDYIELDVGGTAYKLALAA